MTIENQQNDISLGEFLKEARIKTGLKIEEIAVKLKIPNYIIKFLKKNEYFKFPPPVYLKPILKKYAVFLGISFEGIKLNKDVDKFLKESPKFRIRMREALSQLFIDFLPATKSEDTAELKYLVGSQGMLRNNEYMIDPRKPSEEKIKSFFEKARQSLKTVNPQKYDESYAMLDDYQLVKQFDRIYRELKI